MSIQVDLAIQEFCNYDQETYQKFDDYIQEEFTGYTGWDKIYIDYSPKFSLINYHEKGYSVTSDYYIKNKYISKQLIEHIIKKEIFKNGKCNLDQYEIVKKDSNYYYKENNLNEKVFDDIDEAIDYLLLQSDFEYRI